MNLIRSFQYTACTGFIFDKLNANSIRRGEFRLQKQATFEWILEQFGSLKPVFSEFIQNSTGVGFFRLIVGRNLIFLKHHMNPQNHNSKANSSNN